MKSVILVALALVAVAVAAPSEKEPTKIISSEFDQKPDGSYTFNFSTEDGTVRQEAGVVREALDEDNKIQRVVVVSGFYTFFNPEGKLETIKYFADETGFHAEGDSIPKIVSRR